jgi:hypothetical protein
MRAADIVPRNARFLTIARDPRIVPGIYRYCDQWCEHCGATERCLLFKCRQDSGYRGKGRNRPEGRRAAEEIELARQLDAFTPSTDETKSFEHAAILDASGAEALVAVALEYATRSGRVVDGRTSWTRATSRTGPAPHDVIRRFHSGIYAKTTRAVVGATLAAGGMRAWNGDAIDSAARVFAYAARSRAALGALEDIGEGRALQLLLDRLVRGLEGHFPDVMSAHRRVWRALS